MFAFPYFFSCFFPKRAKQIYIISAILFVIWKSQFSQPIFDFAHLYGIGIDRTIDYSDLFALLILPISYTYWINGSNSTQKPKAVLKPLIIAICSFSFVATSLPRRSESYNYKSDFEINVKTDFIDAENKMYLYETSEENKYIYGIGIPERKTLIETTLLIEETENGYLNIKLDSILNYSMEGNGSFFSSSFDKEDVEYVESLTIADIEKLFLERITEQLNEK